MPSSPSKRPKPQEFKVKTRTAKSIMEYSGSFEEGVPMCLWHVDDPCKRQRILATAFAVHQRMCELEAQDSKFEAAA